ncbi:integrator complex subunit 5 [Chironomus tepperi]|uniref:integrator complex subunit 5 n=1 Tax=Chironomus tepperi TaxID=113505 RepID=UPI00391F898C
MNQALLTEIQKFAMGKNFYRDDPAEAIQLVKIALKLLEELPVLRDCISDYFSLIIDTYIANYIKQDKNAPLNESDERIILMIKEGLEKLILEQSWAPTYVSQWTLSKLIKPSVEYAKILNLDFKGSCNLWLGCSATKILLELCGLCFSSFDDTEMKRFIFDLENVFVDNRPNFDWCVAHLSSLFPMKFISNILRMPSMLTPAFIPSTVTVLEYLSNSRDQKLKVLIREIVEEALNADVNELKSKDYIPNLIQLASKSEIYAQCILNVFLEYIELDYVKFLDKIKRQIILRPLDYNPDKLHDILPELILRLKENGTKLLLTLMDNFENNRWCVELVELVILELESMIYNDDKTCPLVLDIRKEKNWPCLWNACTSHKKVLQQTAIRLILLASHQRNTVIFSKSIEKLLSENTLTSPYIMNAIIRLLDENIGCSESPDINIVISHVLQQLSIDLNNVKLQNKCYFTIKNLVDLMTLEKDGQCTFLKRNLVTNAVQSSFRITLQIWETLLRKVMLTADNITKKIETNDENMDDPMQIADIDSECIFGTKDQIHMMTNLVNHLNMKLINVSNAVRCEKITIQYFFWSLKETDLLTKSIIMERCFNLLSKQCSGKKGIRNVATRDLLEGALFLYTDIFKPKGLVQNICEHKNSRKKEMSLLKMNQKQIVSLNFSKSSILLHSGIIGSGISKSNQHSNYVNDVDEEIKNFYVKAIVSCCLDDSEEGDEDKSKIVDGLCNVSQLLVELVSSDVMYNGLHWPIEEDFTKVTMERDLHVRRIFKNCPILWSILGLLAQYRIPLWCNCSVFLRSLCASIMHHWRAKAENRNENNDELLFFTVKFLELLSLAKLLPPPLNNLHIVVVYLEPSEIAYVLKECVWNFFVAKGLNSYNPDLNAELHASEQFINPLRNTMQKKLSILGNMYYQMKFT